MDVTDVAAVGDQNLFANAENIGQLFDALWYHATETADEHVKIQMMGDGDVDPEDFFRKAREHAVGDAHKRFNELGDAAVAKFKA